MHLGPKIFRFCTDFRKVNDKTKSECIDKISHAKYVSTFDMLKGYWQVPSTLQVQEISMFATPSGLYQYKVIPFGMKKMIQQHSKEWFTCLGG